MSECHLVSLLLPRYAGQPGTLTGAPVFHPVLTCNFRYFAKLQMSAIFYVQLLSISLRLNHLQPALSFYVI